MGAGVSEEEHEAKVLHLNSWLGWYCKQNIEYYPNNEIFKIETAEEEDKVKV